MTNTSKMYMKVPETESSIALTKLSNMLTMFRILVTFRVWVSFCILSSNDTDTYGLTIYVWGL